MVRHLAFSDAMRRIFLGLAALLTASTAALADPTTLTCHDDNLNSTILIDLDEANGTATVTYPAYTFMNNGYQRSVPESSSGTLKAQFDPKTITFDQPGDGGGSTHNTINRITGVLLAYVGTRAPYEQSAEQDRGIQTYNCHVGAKQF
ncbi:MAG: hypothetical protein KGJ53_09340 [Alphaproteobacteria bacterium]|nr:hypothetical protein [Alphaproteobacteria bacterium]